MPTESFPQRLKQERNRQCLTQQQVAEKLYVSRKTVSTWETGRNLPDIEMVSRLSVLYDISIDELMGRPNAQNPHVQNRITTLLGPSFAIVLIGRLGYLATSEMLIFTDIVLLLLGFLLVCWWRGSVKNMFLRVSAVFAAVGMIAAAWMNLFSMGFGLRIVYVSAAVAMLTPACAAAVRSVRGRLLRSI